MYSVEKTKGPNFARQFDYPLFLAVLLLSVIGIAVLHSATRVMPSGVNGDRIMLMQIIGMLIGVVLSVILSTIDYKDFKTLGVILYIVSIFLLILVLFIGKGEDQGSKSWFRLPVIGGSFQPSELAKITLILFISVFLERLKEGQKNPLSNLVKFVLYSALPIGLILLQPDYGTSFVFMFIIFVILFAYGIKYRYILGGFLASIPFFVFSWFFILKPYQKGRFLAFFYPEKYQQGSAYNVIKSMMAIGSGQLSGKGLYQGIQTQHMGVPVKESDFIFSVVGEELGFIGAAVILFLIFFILLRCLYIAKNSRDPYGSFIVVGIAGMLAFHFIENIGMCIGILPVTGIPLPFVSAGGSSMVTNYFAIGIVLSVSMRRKRTIFNSTQ